jgi:hypothetical protein
VQLGRLRADLRRPMRLPSELPRWLSRPESATRVHEQLAEDRVVDGDLVATAVRTLAEARDRTLSRTAFIAVAAGLFGPTDTSPATLSLAIVTPALRFPPRFIGRCRLNGAAQCACQRR